MAPFGRRLKHAWNAFTGAQERRATTPFTDYYGNSSNRRPDRPFVYLSNERSIISSIYCRLGIDVASVKIKHVRVDDQERYLEDIDSGLNNCFTVEANVDQAARMFRQDIAMTLFEEGTCAVVPIDTTISPETSGGFDIKTLRIGKIVQWFPYHVRVEAFNEKTGKREELTLPKSTVAIVENPLYSVMNEPNSTLQRLIRKLSLLDYVDDQTASGKLDLIIQLPYVIKSEARRQQAEQRRQDIEFQLKGSKYGIAYTDGTEKITQLNRPVDNNLLQQVKDLTELLYVQLGLTPAVMNGTAAEPEVLNYWDRTIEPVMDAITEAMHRTFLTKTARSQKQRVMYFRDYFKIVPISGEGGMADIADKFTRNEILTSNEVRQIVGFKPSTEPKADQLVNANMPQGDTGVPPPGGDVPAEGDVPDISGMSTEDIFNSLEVPGEAA
jgi:hypothetical protein